MDASSKEILRSLRELLEITERNTARYDRMDKIIASCLTTGGTTPSPSTSVGIDVCGAAEVPGPASPNPVVEVPTPASSDSDAKIVTIDADGPAAPTRTARSTGDPSRDTTELRYAPVPTSASTVHNATVDTVPVLTATEGTLDDQAIIGVALTPTTCSMVCLSRHHTVDAPVLVASSPPTLPEYGLHTNGISVAAVPLVMTGEFPAVLAPTAFTPMFQMQMQQLHNGSKFCMPTSGQRITSKVPRPMLWPSFMGVHVDGVEIRPLPWPSFGKINGCEFPSVAVEKASRRCISDSSPATLCGVIKFSVTDFSELKESVVLNLMSSSNSVRCDEWVLQPWNFGQQADVSYDQFSCANQYTSSLPGYFLTSGQMRISDTSAIWPLFLNSSSASLLLAKFLVQAHEPSGIPLYVSKLAEVTVIGRFYEIENWWSYMLHAWISWILEIVMGCETIVLACFENVKDNLDLLVLTWVSEQEALSSVFQLQCYMTIYLVQLHGLYFRDYSMSIILADWYLHNQCILAAVLLLYSIKYQLLADKWRSQFLDVGLVCTVFLVVLPEDHLMEILQFGQFLGGAWKLTSINAGWSTISIHVKEMQGAYVSAHLQWGNIISVLSCELTLVGKLCLNWKSTHSAFVRPAWPIPAQSVALKILLLTHVYQLTILAPTMFSFAWGNMDCIFNKVSYRVQQYTHLSYFDIQAGLQSFGKSTRKALLLISDLDLSILAMNEVWLLNHHDRMQMLIGWPPSVHAKFIADELVYEDNESRCLLCCYHRGPALFLFLAFDRQAIFQGGRGAMISIICYLGHDSYIDNLDYLDSNGVKVPHVPWDPGGSELLRSSTTTAWGQAVFQGGRGVRSPLHTMGRRCGPWPNHRRVSLLGLH